MKEIKVTAAEAGQRLDKLLSRYLKKAPKSFLYKMLRKKNITLNGKRADGSERVEAGDEVKFFLSEETYAKFAGTPSVQTKESFPTARLDILYEDEHILLVNKPAGMLTQKAKPSDVSLNEFFLGYLQKTGQWPGQEEMSFRPSVCNRLDRNTSGIVVCGKTLQGLRQMSEVLRDRSLHKYYQCIVSGKVEKAQRIKGWLQKDMSANRVQIFREEQQDSQLIVTEYCPLKMGENATLMEVCLITGRSHQIRAHFASMGHPIIGDVKYGDREINRVYRERYGVHSQLLHAYRLVLPALKPPLESLSGKCFEAEPPQVLKKIVEEL